MQNETTRESIPIADRQSRAQGRKARRHSATAKLTRDEHQQLERAARQRVRHSANGAGMRSSPTVRGQTVTPIFTEIVAIRQLLNSTLRNVACGEVMTPQAFQTELQGIRSSKHKAAVEVMQQYAATEAGQ